MLNKSPCKGCLQEHPHATKWLQGMDYFYVHTYKWNMPTENWNRFISILTFKLFKRSLTKLKILQNFIIIVFGYDLQASKLTYWISRNKIENILYHTPRTQKSNILRAPPHMSASHVHFCSSQIDSSMDYIQPTTWATLYYDTGASYKNLSENARYLLVSVLHEVFDEYTYTVDRYQLHLLFCFQKQRNSGGKNKQELK